LVLNTDAIPTLLHYSAGKGCTVFTPDEQIAAIRPENRNFSTIVQSTKDAVFEEVQP
jgi:hypothetical protein